MTDAHGKNQPDSAYAGRWVARVRGRIIAQGATRAEAELAARCLRFKEVPELIYMTPNPDLFHSPLIDAIRAATDQPIYLVGGAVRDHLLNRTSHDLDFAVPQNAIAMARTIANRLNAAFYPLDEENDTGRVVIIENDNRTILDFAGFRGPDLESDLRGRDFTINAIAYELQTEHPIDPLGGVNDLRNKTLRACSETSLSDDPIRILRAIRQAAAFGFTIESSTRKWMKESTQLLGNISAERLRDEIFKILEGPRPDASLRAMEMLGILPVILPELPALKGVAQSSPHVHDIWTHTLAVLRHLEDILTLLSSAYNEEKSNADLLNGLLVLRLGRFRTQLTQHLADNLNTDRSARALLFFSALYHDVCKPETRSMDENQRIRFFGHDEKGSIIATKRGMALHLSNDELDRLKTIIRNHMRVHFHTSRRAAEGKDVSRKAIYRYFRETGPAGIDIILLSLADLRATYDHTLTQETWIAALDVCRTLLEAYYEKPEEIIAPPQLVNGNDMINELNMKPGRDIGLLLELIRENQAAGKLSTREEALAYARGWLDGTKRTG